MLSAGMMISLSMSAAVAQDPSVYDFAVSKNSSNIPRINFFSPGTKATVKRQEESPTIDLLDYPKLPSDLPAVERLFDYTNLVVRHFNEDKIEELPSLFVKDWEERQKSFKYKYGPFKPQAVLFYHEDPQTGKNNPLFIWVESGVKMGGPGSLIDQKHLRQDTAMEAEKRDSIGNICTFYVVFHDGKIQVAGGFLPMIDEDYCCILRRRTTLGDSFQLMTFSYKDWPKEDTKKESPWMIWGRDGEIMEYVSKRLLFEDYDVTTFLDGNPILRQNPLPQAPEKREVFDTGGSRRAGNFDKPTNEDNNPSQ